MRALVSAGVPTAAPLQRLDDGGWLEQCVLKPVAAFAWVDGHFTCQAKVTAGLCHALGEALAHLHAATPYCAPLPPSRFEPPDLMKRLDFAARAAPELAEAADAIGGKLEVYAGKRTAEMPSGLIHGDLFRENVLWQDGALRSLVDFECAGQGRYAYDLMVSMLAWCFGHRFDMALVGALLRGYCRHRRLTAREIQGLHVEAALGCLRFATTRLVDFSLPTRPGDTPVRDFRRFLARLEALERGAGTELVALATDASAGLQRRP